MDEVVKNKIAMIKRCLKRIREEYEGHEELIEIDFTKQDSIILNLQRLCEASMDLGNRIIALEDLGLPQSSREIFTILGKAGYISDALSKNLEGMVGFRNIAVHDYQKVNLNIVKSIIEKHLVDFTELIDCITKKQI